jgi:hypothetical protein
VRPAAAHAWEYTELEVRLPRLRWFQLPKTWLPSIAWSLEQLQPDGWRPVHEVDVPTLVATGAFRRGDDLVERAADADRVLVPVKRRVRARESARTA